MMMRKSIKRGGAAVASYLQSLLRIVSAIVFMLHGTQKLFGFPSATPLPPSRMLSLLGAAGILEVCGGALMALGLFTRPVAFILSGEMAVAYFRQHAPRGLWPILNGGELAVLFCFLWLFFSAAGPGRISVDTLIRKKR
jgi:putative oxidoreductase